MNTNARVPARLTIALFLIAMGLSACGAPGESGTVTRAQAHALVAEGATLVDVRTDGEWQSGHLEVAVHIPVDALQGRMNELARDHTVVVYCGSGQRSAHAASVLRGAGYEVRDLGAMSNWN